MHDLTTAPVVAVVPVEVPQPTCGEVADELAGLSCDTDYHRLSMSAVLCCGGGASYCPAPQLCADHAAFDPAAVFEHVCTALLSAEFDESACLAAGCHPLTERGFCSCEVADKEACLAKLPGELSRACADGACVLCEVDGCMRTSAIECRGADGTTGGGSGSCHILCDHMCRGGGRVVWDKL
jgi:hypothetical protein